LKQAKSLEAAKRT